jgi:Na+/H+-translocating membrane pyrophosphatase
MAFREITGTEMQRVRDAVLNVTGTMVAVESVAVIAHNATGVSELTADQVRRVFASKVGNWNEMGGADLHVPSFVPGPLEPPCLFFNNPIMAGTPFANGVRFVNDSQGCADALANASGRVEIVRGSYLDLIPGIIAIINVGRRCYYLLAELAGRAKQHLPFSPVLLSKNRWTSRGRCGDMAGP